jgi:hypothetical protein
VSTADHILDQIDDALEDWSVSDDAMRSRPAAEPGIRGATPTVQIMDEVGEWQELRGVTGIELHIDSAEFDQAMQALREQIARVQAERVRQVQQVLGAVRVAFAAMAKPAAKAADNFRHLPEAVGCNDCGTPAPRRDRPAWQSPYGPARRRRR